VDNRFSAYDYVPVAELDEAPLRVAISPLPTVFTLTRDALQGGRKGTPQAWRSAALSRFRARDAAALAPLAHPKTTGWPGCLDDNEAPRETIDEALQRVADIRGAELLEALETDPDVTPTPAWNPVRGNPERWLRAYVDAIARGWRSLEPLWRRSSALLEREADRIDAASARGVPATQLITELNPRATVAGGELRLVAGSEPRRLGIGPRGVTVAPMIVGGEGGILSSPEERFARMAYPLHAAWRAFDDQAPPPASLHALLGEQRTALLRRLDRAETAGGLAVALGLAPSAITFHLRALESAGLVARERRGRHVIVERTSRGTRLLALYRVP
jgi:DNA-binding transcriptional ArsR family regulator